MCRRSSNPHYISHYEQSLSLFGMSLDLQSHLIFIQHYTLFISTSFVSSFMYVHLCLQYLFVGKNNGSCDSLSGRSEVGGSSGDNSYGNGSTGSANNDVALGTIASETLKKQLRKASALMIYQQKLHNLITDSMSKQRNLYDLFHEKLKSVDLARKFGNENNLYKSVLSSDQQGCKLGTVVPSVVRMRSRSSSSNLDGNPDDNCKINSKNSISSSSSSSSSNDQVNNKGSEVSASIRAELQIMSEMRAQMDMHRRLIEHRCDQLGLPPQTLGLAETVPSSNYSSSFSSSSSVDNNQSFSGNGDGKTTDNNNSLGSPVGFDNGNDWWDVPNDNNFDDNLFGFLEMESDCI